ncbi:hypothetical protein [uncultured Castellaniella sp.]|uniref:hypothetical protein n=1 Tax=uncultured Castellaniella sp. TaxID=647907 RepID=UPI00260E80B4|nr:hypothetical protein [uncultured Castellaniella sp.]
MTGQEVYEVLMARGSDKLYHANSVKTSLSLLRLGGLASRGEVMDRKLPQTSQISDQEDREYEIWYDIFVDTHDIHSVLRRRNFYGPVLFVMDAKLLLRLPLNSTVLVTRCNPTKWKGLPNDQRYFLTMPELAAGLKVGYFDHMITIRSPNGIIPFSDTLERIILDEPRLSAPDVSEDYVAAQGAISEAVAKAGIRVQIERRICDVCNCKTEYQDPDKPKRIGYFFTP